MKAIPEVKNMQITGHFGLGVMIALGVGVLAYFGLNLRMIMTIGVCTAPFVTRDKNWLLFSFGAIAATNFYSLLYYIIESVRYPGQSPPFLDIPAMVIGAALGCLAYGFLWWVAPIMREKARQYLRFASLR